MRLFTAIWVRRCWITRCMNYFQFRVMSTNWERDTRLCPEWFRTLRSRNSVYHGIQDWNFIEFQLWDLIKHTSINLLPLGLRGDLRLHRSYAKILNSYENFNKINIQTHWFLFSIQAGWDGCFPDYLIIFPMQPELQFYYNLEKCSQYSTPQLWRIEVSTWQARNKNWATGSTETVAPLACHLSQERIKQIN